MNKIKIFIEKTNNIQGEKKNIIYNGLILNNKIEITDDINICDYIFMDFRDYNIAKKYKPEFLDKLIVIDFKDKKELLNIRCLKYFKRSIVNKKNNTLIKFNKEIIPISYCLRNEVLNFKNIFNYQRDIDISIFFKPGKKTFRTRIAEFIKNNFNEYNIHIGLAGKAGVEGRNKIQNKYFNKMFHSKIIVTCNPCRWEGDYRTWEALSSGALVLVDNMKTPIKNPLINEKHLVFYNRNNLNELKEKILFYLKNDDLREKIAKEGNDFVLKHHKTSDRINEILEELK